MWESFLRSLLSCHPRKGALESVNGFSEDLAYRVLAQGAWTDRWAIVSGGSEETPGWWGELGRPSAAVVVEMAFLSWFILLIKETYCYYHFPQSNFSSKSLLGFDIIWLVMRTVKCLVLIMAIWITNMEWHNKTARTIKIIVNPFY